MKKMQFKQHSGLNFKKLIKKLSNNALKYLINVAYHEASYRNLKINIQNLGDDLPTIELYLDTLVTIRDKTWKCVEYTFGDGEWTVLSPQHSTIFDFENLDWYQKYKDKTPISIKLISTENENEEKIIEFHSRSKIFWFAKLLNS